MTLLSFIKVTLLVICFPYVCSIPDEGKWECSFSKEGISVSRSLFAGSEIFIRISCDSHKDEILVGVILDKSLCWNMFTQEGMLGELQKEMLLNYSDYQKYSCADSIVPDKVFTISKGDMKPKVTNHNASSSFQKPSHTNPRTPVIKVDEDGVYLLLVSLKEVTVDFKGTIYIEIKGPNGYLSAAEWPLLPFYAVMCLVYVAYALVWLLISFLQWRDLLRIQFWIGAVIFIGMIEKALFYEEYQTINSTGESSFLGTVFVAELVSAIKRSLARILVIIVSLGYGIVKPRLGSHFPRIVAVGLIYFILASIEAYLRVMGQKNEPSKYLLLASIPLALVDSLICWWIFSSLVQTTRTLRLRRNLVKLTLYNRFTNTLIFAVIASTIFMLYSIKTHRITSCLTDWSQLWLDDAFWHILFSVLLLVIMVLWRPTNNNQRYAFSPLMDAPDDEDDDEEVEHFVNDAYGVKMRGVGSRSDSPKQRNNLDDDLKWVEENIPSSLIDTSLPVLDSDEELINTKFEMSKME